MTLKQRIIRLLERLDEDNPEDKEKLKLIYQLIDRVFVGKKMFWY